MTPHSHRLSGGGNAAGHRPFWELDSEAGLGGGGALGAEAELAEEVQFAVGFADDADRELLMLVHGRVREHKGVFAVLVTSSVVEFGAATGLN